MNFRCFIGLHDWETIPWGTMYHVRECKRCQRSESKTNSEFFPRGHQRWRRELDGSLTKYRLNEKLGIKQGGAELDII